MVKARSTWWSWLAVLFVLVVPAPTAAQPAPPPDQAEQGSDPAAIAEAKVRYRRGTQLYRKGDYKLALIEFQRSYRLAPHYKIKYNIGQVNMQLNNYAAALKAFEQYLAEGGDEVSAERRSEIQAELPELRDRTAHLVVISNVEGADVLVDGVPVGKTPLDPPMLVDAGEHHITVAKGGRSAVRYITLAGAEQLRLEIELPTSGPAPPPSGPASTGAPSPGPKPGPDRPTDTPDEEAGYGWVAGWVVTGVLAGAAIGTGIAALDAQSSLDDERKGETTTEQLEDAETEARALSISTDVLIGAAVVAAGFSLYFTLTAGPDEPEGPSEASLRLGVSPGRLSLQGAF